MLIVLSPAKSMDLDTPFKTKLKTAASFLDRSAQLIEALRAYSPAELSELMSLSDSLAALNVARYADWTAHPEQGRQAVMLFDGDVYGGLQARSLTPKQLAYTQDTVRILSGLYGVLRPLDLIQPHRLEMGTRLATPQGKNLYEFWGNTVTEELNRSIAAKAGQVLVNLASDEYFSSVKPKLLNVPVITPHFEDWKNGKYKVISFFAKRARGMMARYAAVKGVTEVDKLKRFKEDGYAFDKKASDAKNWVFRRRIEA